MYGAMIMSEQCGSCDKIISLQPLATYSVLCLIHLLTNVLTLSVSIC